MLRNGFKVFSGPFKGMYFLGVIQSQMNDSQRTVLIHLWKPDVKAKSLAKARYRSSYVDDTADEVQVLSLKHADRDGIHIRCRRENESKGKLSHGEGHAAC